jgi:MrcB-like, N-terminal domain/Domain of unknown function (DUF3883)
MSLSSLFVEVCALQLKHSDSNTTAMMRRGAIIRDEIPRAILSDLDRIANRAGLPKSDVLVRGKDGTGRKSHIPWVRLASRERSPSPTLGWYVVYLWRRDGAGVYLTLAHGSTEYRDGSFVPRSMNELARHVRWARAILDPVLRFHRASVAAVELGSTTALALAYEKSCPTALFYPSLNMPGDEEIRNDLAYMMEMLRAIYEEERLGHAPSANNPEVREALHKISGISSPLKATGQGFGLTSAERIAVEQHAVRVATDFLIHDGYAVTNRGETESYDLLAIKNDVTRFIEVKGTTGLAERILLTANEVDLHISNPDNNGLIVVHSIDLTKGVPPNATGGTLIVRIPWSIDKRNLRALSFTYEMDEIHNIMS